MRGPERRPPSHSGGVKRWWRMVEPGGRRSPRPPDMVVGDGMRRGSVVRRWAHARRVMRRMKGAHRSRGRRPTPKRRRGHGTPGQRAPHHGGTVSGSGSPAMLRGHHSAMSVLKHGGRGVRRIVLLRAAHPDPPSHRPRRPLLLAMTPKRGGVVPTSPPPAAMLRGHIVKLVVRIPPTATTAAAVRWVWSPAGGRMLHPDLPAPVDLRVGVSTAPPPIVRPLGKLVVKVKV